MLKGVFTPIVTIFNEAGEIDYKGNARVIERLIKAGVDGILFLGSIGEFFSLSLEEKLKFITFAVKTVDKRAKVLIGTGGTVMDEVISLTQYAESEGADAAVLISPYYFNLDDESIYRYYAEAASSVKMPILLYNFPDRTSVNLSPQLIHRLARDFGNIVGIKDTVDNISHTRKVIAEVKADIKEFSIFSGFDEYFIPNLLAGGSGIITGLTNIAPELFVNFYKAFEKNDLQTADEAQKKINILMNLYDISQPFVSSIKTAVSMLVPGISADPRKPFAGCSQEQVEKVREILKKAEVI
ncbi:MAG: 4-hydroxy-tetrahydrodipicolinate synthase [Bacillota bacterium]|nr:4-hydroxy-tetrahydrodipicolinate synthase [Bacillota bacterium]